MDKDNLNENEKIEYEKNKLMIQAEYALGFSSLLVFLGAAIGSEFLDVSDSVKSIFIISGGVIFVACASFGIRLEQKAGYYKCTKCDHTYVPDSYLKVFFAPHFGTTRYMECPHCGEKSFQKKVLIKK